MRKQYFYRILFYAGGLLVLALGLTLNTKTGLGVSPIISVAYSTATILTIILAIRHWRFTAFLS